MKIIVGLGNPGKEYECTNHNAGFMVIDGVTKELGINCSKLECNALVCSTFVNGEKFMFVKPQTFMNNSGISVRQLVNKYKIDVASELVIISDDFDCKEGTIRIRNTSGSTTHNGVKSIKSELETNEFIRIKVSIAPKPEFMSVVDFVLAKIKNESTNNAINKATLAVLDFVNGESLSNVMQKYSN